jgi:hypothetical protein
VAAGITKRPSRNPDPRASADAGRGPDFDAPAVADAISNAEGRNEGVSARFHVGSDAVTGRLTCLIVAPVFVITKVTPPPE